MSDGIEDLSHRVKAVEIFESVLQQASRTGSNWTYIFKSKV